MNKDTAKALIDVMMGRAKADLAIRNARIVNVFTRAIETGSIAVKNGYIAGSADGIEASEEIDAGGRYLVPGLIDAHCHIESSHLSPSEYSDAIVPGGTATVIADPHEICNVCGLAGLDYMLKASDKIPLSVYLMIPSCVPATPFEHSGAMLKAEDIAKYIVRGGWPAAIDFSAEDAAYFVRAYIDGIISEDVPRVAPSTDLAKITRFMRSLARNESTTASRNTIRKDFNGEISDDTASSYTTILTRLFQLDDIPPYSPEVRSSLRVKQMSKHHYVDPSIPAALLRLNVRSLMNDLQTFGFLFESLALRDLLIYSSANGFNLYHYQDYRDNEVDAVVEAEDGSFGLIEIKLGTEDIEKGIKSLLKTNKALIETSGKGAKFLCVISGLTPYAYKDTSGVIVVPLTALRP